MSELYVGLMSGTSLDGVDGVLASFDQEKLKVLAYATVPFSESLTLELMALNSAGPNELHRAALAANGLVRVYAEVVQALLQQSALSPSDITAIGAHGQTVRHQPQAFDGTGYTLQLNNPALMWWRTFAAAMSPPVARAHRWSQGFTKPCSGVQVTP